MNWIGRIIGVVLGWKIGGPLGAVLGYFAGFFFDKARIQFSTDFNPENRQKVEHALFNSIFPLLGHLAKSDGRVSEEEVQAAEAMMNNMKLSPEMRKEAIKLFKEGTEPEFNLELTMQNFIAICGRYADVKQLTIVYLITMAMSDGTIHPSEETILREVASKLGFSAAAFGHLLRMASAQQHFHQGGGHGESGFGGRPSSEQELAFAYEALGVSADINDAELKRAYRKLISEYHPDKLIGKGVPEEMIKVATERSQEIQTAYDLIKKHRK